MSLKEISRPSFLALLLAPATMALAQFPPQAGMPTPGGAIPPAVTEAPPATAAPGEAVLTEPEPLPSTQRRDPFWPVGYAPPRPVRIVPKATPGAAPGTVAAAVVAPEPEPVKTQDWEQARRRLDFRGLSTLGRDPATGKPRYVAMMAGKLVEAGDTVAAAFEGQVYRWKIVSIGSNGVSMVKVDVHAE